MSIAVSLQLAHSALPNLSVCTVQPQLKPYIIGIDLVAYIGTLIPLSLSVSLSLAIHIYIYICVYIYMLSYMHACMHACMHIHIYIYIIMHALYKIQTHIMNFSETIVAEAPVSASDPKTNGGNGLFRRRPKLLLELGTLYLGLTSNSGKEPRALNISG